MSLNVAAWLPLEAERTGTCNSRWPSLSEVFCYSEIPKKPEFWHVFHVQNVGFSSIVHSRYAAQPSLNPLSDPSWFSDGRKTKPLKTSCFCAQLRLTLCNLMDCSPSGSSVHGNLQARILEWVATSYSRGCSRPREQTHISCIGRWTLKH